MKKIKCIYDVIVEHLKEVGKVVLQGNENVSALIANLEKMGYYTHYEETDREYLVLDCQEIQ